MRVSGRIGPYEAVAKLGAGGMGEVWRARDPRIGREVALKILPAEFASDPERLRRFEQEARAAGALNHPNVLTVFDVGEHEGTPYLVTELLEGETLRGRLAAGVMPARKTVEIGAQIAHGLAAAHDRGIVHRDLKPENVFLTNDGRVKILDFGLAKLIDPGGLARATTLSALPTGATEAGRVLGTVGYMAPEQVRGGQVDQRADIFALGVLLHEMISGANPFLRTTSVETLNAILNEEMPNFAVTGREIAPGLESVVRHCLEKRPEQRFQAARDLAFDLEALSTVSSPTARSAGASGRLAFRWALPVATVVFLALAGAVAYLAVQAKAWRTPRSASFRQLTLRRQTIFAARFAPDGRTIVFSAAHQGTTPELFSVRTDSPDPKSLGFRGVHLLAVSSKGELAVLTGARYIAHNIFRGTLARMPFEGGAPRDVLENAREADWSPDGSAIAVIREIGGKDRLEFPVGNVLCEGGGYLSDPRFSPRGDRIAFFEHPSKWDDQGNVAVVDLAGRKTALTPVYWGVEGLAWTPDGEEVLFSRGNSYAEFAVNATTLSGRCRVVLESAGGLTIRDSSRENQWLLTHDEILDEIPVLAPGQTVERNLEWLDSSNFPVLSPDGKTVIFTEQNGSVGPNYALCLRGTDGSPLVRLGDGTSQDLSPDSKSVLAVIQSSPQQLMLYPIGAGEARRLDGGGIEAYDWVRFFPDGKSALVCGREAGRATRCYVQEIPAGKPRPVTPEGTSEGIVSPDARSILVSTSGGGLAVYPAEGGAGRMVPGTGPEDNKSRWCRDGRSVLVYRSGEVPARIERLDVETGQRQLVRTLGPADLEGVIKVFAPSFSEDENSYAYVCVRAISHLFLAEAVR